MCIPSQITCNCYSKVFNAFNVFKDSSLYGIWSMDLLDPFSCQLHHIAFDRLKSHTPLPCQGTQSINITLKFHCVFFILNFTIANTVISKKSYFRLNIWWDVIYVQREQQGTKNGALGDTRQNRSPVRFYSIYNNSLLSEAKKRIYPFQCLATDSIAKQFAFKEFMRGCIKDLYLLFYFGVNRLNIAISGIKWKVLGRTIALVAWINTGPGTQVVDCPPRGTGGHRFDSRPRHTKVVKWY